MHPLTHTRVASAFWLLWVVLLCVPVYVFAWTSVFSLGIVLGVQLLSHRAILCLTCWETAKLFHSIWTILHSPLAVQEGSDFSTSWYALVVCYFCCGCCLTHPSVYEVVSFCNLDLHFTSDWWWWESFHDYWPFTYLFWRNVYLSPLPIFSWPFSCCWIVRVLYIF